MTGGTSVLSRVYTSRIQKEEEENTKQRGALSHGGMCDGLRERRKGMGREASYYNCRRMFIVEEFRKLAGDFNNC
ncbi:hypothetical protein M5689_025154 [Euphorbia peplus]|nr:hypothetical protein M5689_025154 [Euphorbia peplus]